VNVPLKSLPRFGWSKLADGRNRSRGQAASSVSQRESTPSNYARGIYAGHSTFTCDFRSQGSFASDA
jgi:hypothetical protein